MTKYTFGGEPFSNQDQIKARFKQLKSRITINNFDDGFAFLRDLYWRTLPEQRPLADPVQFCFVPHGGHGGSELGVLVYLSNGEVWKYPSYLYGLRTPDAKVNDESHWHKLRIRRVRDKMRDMVKYQMDLYRTGPCDWCGTPGPDVDHFPVTFAEIRDEWLELNPDALYAEIIDHTDDNSEPHFADEELDVSWLEWHDDHAEYRLLCKLCHRHATHNDLF